VTRKSRENFPNFSVFPDDHRQTATAKFDAFLSRGALVRTKRDASPFTHSFLGMGLRFSVGFALFAYFAG
jgi:hypothetical protein